MASNTLFIHSPPNNPRVHKVQITAKYNGLEVALKEVDMKAIKTPEFLAKNPVGKVPVLETSQGYLFESNAIARYVARLSDKGKLYGNNSYEAGLVDQWIDFAANEVELPAAAWLYPILNYVPNIPAATTQARADLRKVLKILDDHLLHRTFLVNERVTLADIVLTIALLRPYTMVFDTGFRKQFTNTNRWFQTCINQPIFKSVLGEVKLCTKMAKSPEGPKEEKPVVVEKKETKPQEKPQPKKEKAAAEEGAEEAEDKPKKSPFAHLPPNKFDLREWKGQYTNTDTREVALPWFWAKWEEVAKEGWSLWFCDYKYNHELDAVFRTSNLIGGFVQRAEELRDHAFGSFAILGEPNAMEVHGAWLLRGHELPEVLKEVPDFQTYDWRGVDLTNPEDKEYLEDIWAWNGKFKGKTFIDGKVFK